MDSWASLEHELAYKLTESENGDVARELKACAQVIADTGLRMQALHNIVTRSSAMNAPMIAANTLEAGAHPINDALPGCVRRTR